MPALAYQTPGVYFERLDASAPAISAIRMDVAGFVGIAERGPLDRPVPVQSWRQFEAHFGGFTGTGFLAYAVRAFFENGGRRCWVVRVAARDALGGAAAAATTLRLDSTGEEAWRIVASSPGVWGNALTVRLVETHRAQTLTDPARSTPESSAVRSTSGFDRAAMVRVSQGGAGFVFKVVSGVDAVEGQLYWVHPDPEARLPYDGPLTGFDPDQPLLIESVEYTLLVREAGRLAGVFEGLSLVPEHPRYGPQVLPPLSIVDPLDLRESLPPTPLPVFIEELRTSPVLTLAPLDLASDTEEPLEGGVDGLALLQPYDFMGEPVDPRDSDFVQERKRRGFRALELVDEVAAVAVPDIHVQPVSPPARAPRPVCVPDPCLAEDPPPIALPRPPVRTEAPPVFSESEVYRVQAALVDYCEARRDRIALLDPPVAAALDDEEGPGVVRAWRQRFDSEYAAFYWPWLRVVDPLRAALTREVPPSGHVAGQFARSDFEVGVHKAPANAVLAWVQDVTLSVDDAIHGLLNVQGINVIRTLPGRGIRIMGARTLSSDPRWRFLNVRRLMLMIRKAIDLSTQWATFEPNDAVTRAKLRLTLTSFLVTLWQQGALVGDTAEAAFFVRCDEVNNPAFERDRGRLFADVGVAPSIPYEFIVLRVGRTDNAFEITESTSLRGV